VNKINIDLSKEQKHWRIFSNDSKEDSWNAPSIKLAK
jgi:hypothetical protein